MLGGIGGRRRRGRQRMRWLDGITDLMDVRVGLWRKLSGKELMVWTVVLEKTLESPVDCKEIQLVHPKGNQSWIFIGRADAEAETPILWPLDVNSQLIGKDPDSGNDWRWEEGEGRGWDGWMISLTRWTWVWVSSRSWWWAGKPGVLQSVGSQRVRHDWVTKLNWLRHGLRPSWLYLQSSKIQWFVTLGIQLHSLKTVSSGAK